MTKIKIVQVEEEQTNNTSYGDLSMSSDPREGLSSLRWEISRLQTLEQGLEKFSKPIKTQSSHVLLEASRQARRDTMIRKSLAIVVGIGLLAGSTMAVLALVQVMKDKNVRFVGESGGNSPVTWQELQMHNTKQDCWLLLHDDVYDLTSYARNHPGGEFLVTDLAGKEASGSFDAFHPVQLLKTVQRYRIGPLVKVAAVVEDRESDGASLDNESSDSEDQDQGTPPDNEENAGPPTEGNSQEGTPPDNEENAGPPAEGNSQEVVVSTISREELALHGTPADCWLALHGNVYDLTGYAPSHPGGVNMITQLAGTDGTDLFDIFHEPILLQTVQTFKVGPLAAPLARN